MAGIAAAAFYLPRFSISAEEYRKAVGRFDAPGIVDKSVPGYDEDEVTMAVAAGERAIGSAFAQPAFLAYGSSSRTPALETVGAALGLESAANEEVLGDPDAGVAALRIGLDRAASGGDALVVVADAPRAYPGSSAEHPLGGGAIAFVVTNAGAVRRTDGTAPSVSGRDVLVRVGYAGAVSPLLALVDALSQMAPGSRLSVDDLTFDIAARPAGDLDLRGALDARIPITYDAYLAFRRYNPAPPGTEFSQGAYVSLPAYLGERKARYRLVGERCTACGTLHFPPREACRSCGAREWEETPLKRTGKVYAYTIIGKGAAPSEFLELQQVIGEYAAAIVELDDGPRVAAMLTDANPKEVRVGMPVRMVFRRIYTQEGVTRYGFKFAPE